MSEGTRRKWWRAAALTVGCGGVAGGWYGLARADSSFLPPAKVEPAVWTRSSASSGVTPAAPAFFPPRAQPVTAAAAAVPVVVMPPAPAPLVPPAPVTAPVPPATTAGLAGSAAQPEFKAVPPKPITPASAAADVTPRPALPPLPDMPKAPAALPPLPVPSAPVKPPEKPDPIAPTLPPLPGVAPPAKSADPVKPVPPIKSDFNLQPGNAGNTVKSDAVPPKAFVPPALLTPPAPVKPVHTEPAIAPPARTVSRAKPADEPMAPSAKSVFVAPAPAPAAPVVPPATVPVAVVPPATTAVATAPPPAVPKVPVTPTSVERPTSIKPDTLAPTPGVDPMTLRQSVLAATIGGALAFPPPAPAAGPAPSVPVASAVKPVLPAVPVKADPTVDDKLKAADEKQKATDEKLKALDKKIDDLTELLKGRKDSTGVVVPSDPGVVEEVKRLKDELARLKTAMDEMKKSTSLRPSTGGTTTPTPTPTPADPLAGKGTVRVVNDYPIEITMVVNGNSYRVAAGTKLDIPVPAGEFNYKLLSAGANLAETKSPIKEKEVVTLRIK